MILTKKPAKISVLSSGKIDKYEYLTDEERKKQKDAITNQSKKLEDLNDDQREKN